MKYLLSMLGFALSLSYISAQTSDATQSTSLARQVANQEYYKLYPTENIYTFLKLDTRDGTIAQVQWGEDESYRFEVPLNLFPLVSEEEQVVNRFALYPTQNMYTFLLLDQINGKTRQVQWSQEYSERLVLPIILSVD